MGQTPWLGIAAFPLIADLTSVEISPDDGISDCLALRAHSLFCQAESIWVIDRHLFVDKRVAHERLIEAAAASCDETYRTYRRRFAGVKEALLSPKKNYVLLNETSDTNDDTKIVQDELYTSLQDLSLREQRFLLGICMQGQAEVRWTLDDRAIALLALYRKSVHEELWAIDNLISHYEFEVKESILALTNHLRERQALARQDPTDVKIHLEFAKDVKDFCSKLEAIVPDVNVAPTPTLIGEPWSRGNLEILNGADTLIQLLAE